MPSTIAIARPTIATLVEFHRPVSSSLRLCASKNATSITWWGGGMRNRRLGFSS